MEMKVTLSSIAFWWTSAITIRDAISWPPRYNIFCCLSDCKFTLDPAMSPQSSQGYNLYIHENESCFSNILIYCFLVDCHHYNQCIV